MPSPPLPPPATSLCLPTFQMHGPSYFRTAGGYLTNDLAWRREQAGMSGNGSAAAPALPDLPAGAPPAWLQRYQPSTTCRWTFVLPANASAVLTMM